MKIISKIFIFLSLSLVCISTNAFDISSLGPINSSVIDKVGILNYEEKALIEAKIQELRDKYTTEILIVVIPTTNGEEISSIATEIGQKVGVGKSDKDNGVVILLAFNERSWSIATGYGVEGVLPDLLTKRIGEKNFILFKEAKYYDGIMGALGDFDKAFSGDKSIISDTKNSNNEEDQLWIIIVFIAIFVSSIFFKPILHKKNYKKFLLYFLIAYLLTLPFVYIFIGFYSIIVNFIMWVVGSILGIIGKLGKGGYTSSGGSRGGGGFGGFGGGGFGGGGSSGKW
nr:TPM domain-containing protein [Candidatus Gracilibacteria bacterium]